MRCGWDSPLSSLKDYLTFCLENKDRTDKMIIGEYYLRSRLGFDKVSTKTAVALYRIMVAKWLIR